MFIRTYIWDPITQKKISENEFGSTVKCKIIDEAFFFKKINTSFESFFSSFWSCVRYEHKFRNKKLKLSKIMFYLVLTHISIHICWNSTLVLEWSNLLIIDVSLVDICEINDLKGKQMTNFYHYLHHHLFNKQKLF